MSTNAEPTNVKPTVSFTGHYVSDTKRSEKLGPLFRLIGVPKWKAAISDRINSTYIYEQAEDTIHIVAKSTVGSGNDTLFTLDGREQEINQLDGSKANVSVFFLDERTLRQRNRFTLRNDKNKEGIMTIDRTLETEGGVTLLHQKFRLIIDGEVKGEATRVMVRKGKEE